MNNYKFRSDEFYKDSLSKTRNKNRESEKVSQQSFDVPIESKPNTYKKTTTVRLNVRKKPNGEILTQLEKDTEIEVLKEYNSEWTELVDGTYVMSKYLK